MSKAIMLRLVTSIETLGVQVAALTVEVRRIANQEDLTARRVDELIRKDRERGARKGSLRLAAK